MGSRTRMRTREKLPSSARSYRPSCRGKTSMGNETWVLLRGLVREQRHWEGFDDLVRARFGARVLTPDLPGNGARHKEPSPLSIGATVDVLRAELRDEGVTGKVFVVAQSLGGMVTIEWMRRH